MNDTTQGAEQPSEGDLHSERGELAKAIASVLHHTNDVPFETAISQAYGLLDATQYGRKNDPAPTAPRGDEALANDSAHVLDMLTQALNAGTASKNEAIVCAHKLISHHLAPGGQQGQPVEVTQGDLQAGYDAPAPPVEGEQP